MRILVIDDNPADVNLIQEFLEDISKTECTIQVIANGTEALRFLVPDEGDCLSPVDLIILDLNLPGRSGHEILEVLNEYKNSTPIIVYSGSSNRDDIDRAYLNKASCYVVKPMTYEEITEVMATLGKFWLTIAKLPSRGLKP
jgi:CheY-like chemotaxis protein